MPMERLVMRKIREVLRLKHVCGLSNVKIAASCNISRESVRNYLMRVSQANLPWPLPEGLDDGALERLLFPSENINTRLPQPDCQWVHQELKRKGVTKWLLWEEHKATHPDGVSYSRFCQLYREFKATLSVSMRQSHVAGDKLFVDYAGLTITLIDRTTGEELHAQIFVAVLGASNYTFVEATRTQSLQDWIGSHVRAFQFFGGVPAIVVPDNLKSGVTKAHYYDPEINKTYQEMANHYGVAIVPARARKPQDKSKVEVGVQGIERRILAKLRHRQFFSITEINQAIRPLLDEYNCKPFQRLIGSRLSEYQQLEKAALKPLPTVSYEYAQWKKVRAGIDYHIAVDHHFYSVPYRYKGIELDLRITQTTIECFCKSKAIATHQRSYKKGHTTIKEHMPKSHQEYAEWTPERLTRWASQTGEHTAQLIQAMIDARPQPQQAFRACLGVMRLGKSYGNARLEKAAERAIAIGAFSYNSIASILKNGLDQKPLPTAPSSSTTTTLTHHNVRGANYYH